MPVKAVFDTVPVVVIKVDKEAQILYIVLIIFW